MSYLDAFVMPTQVTIMARTSSITNSFVNGIIPCIAPTEDEVAAALSVLGMDEESVACAYCGDPMTEWDHLNPLVRNKRPTGFISEINNLVPACGKCNQSKGNKPWRKWIVSGARKSPRSRGVPDLEGRIARLEEYERTFEPVRLDFESIVGPALWEAHWKNLERVHEVMKQCQKHSDLVKQAIAGSVSRPGSFPGQHQGAPECHGDGIGAQSYTQPQKEQGRPSAPASATAEGACGQLPAGLEGVDSLVNQRFAMRCLEYLRTHSSNLDEDLETLCSKEGCKAAFNHDQALLKPLDGLNEAEKAREDGNGHPRYYKAPTELQGRHYLVSKEWYGLGEGDRDNRTPFLVWLVTRLM